MTSDHGGIGSPTFHDYVRVLRRRAPVMALFAVLALAAGWLYVSSTTPLHVASSEVLLSRTSPAATLAGIAGADDRGDPERFVQTRAEVARTESLAGRVLTAEKLRDRRVKDLVAATTVVVRGSADILEFRVRDASSSLAVRLAGQYAAQFVDYQRELDRAALERARREIRTRLDAIVRRDGPAAAASSKVYRQLLARDRQLESDEPLDTGKALVLSAPTESAQIRPRPRRDFTVALALGLLLGIVAAFALEGLDRRLDSPSAVSRRLGMPLLGHVAPARGLRRAEHLTLVAGPEGRQVETFQILRRSFEASLDSAGLDAPGSVIMLTSPTRRDGKSTTVSNLAVALALAGRRVLLLDLDRRPSMHRVFGVDPGPGLAGVVGGGTSVDEALVHVATGGRDLALLPVGTSGGTLDAFLAGDGLPDVLERLRPLADLILVDAPPLLAGGGAREVARHADALVLVVRLTNARDRVLAEVRSMLGARGLVKLGFVGTGAVRGVVEDPPPGPVVALTAARHRDDAVAGLRAEGDEGDRWANLGHHERSRA